MRLAACGTKRISTRNCILVRALAHLGSFEQVARMHVLKARYQRRFLAAVRSLVEHAALARCACRRTDRYSQVGNDSIAPSECRTDLSSRGKGHP